MNYSLNFLWLPRSGSPRHESQYLYDKKVPCYQSDPKVSKKTSTVTPIDLLEENLFYPAILWAKKNPQADTTIWYDSSKHSAGCITRSHTALNNYKAKHNIQSVHFADIQSINIVKNNPIQFSNAVGLYTRIDFLKIIICHHQMFHKRYEHSIFSDLTLPKTIPGPDQLFCQEALNALKKQGILLNYKNTFKRSFKLSEPIILAASAENQFLQCSNNPIICQVLADCINTGIIHITNHLRFMPRQSMQLLYHYFFQFFSAQNKNITIRRLYIAYKNRSYLALQPHEILQRNIHTTNIKQPLRYDPKIHGYFPLGDVFDHNSYTNLCIYNENNKENIQAFELLSLPNDPSLVRTDILYRDGKSHLDNIPCCNHPDLQPQLLTTHDQNMYSEQQRYSLALTLLAKRQHSNSVQQQFDQLFGLSMFVVANKNTTYLEPRYPTAVTC